MKFGTVVQHLCQMSLLTFERSMSKFKVKPVVVKKNLPFVIARLWFKIPSANSLWQWRSQEFATGCV